MNPASSKPEAAEDRGPTMRIRGSLLCISCRYDLHGLATTAVCPECSAPVARTLGSLHAAPLSDVIRLQSGLRLMWIAILIGVFGVVTARLSSSLQIQSALLDKSSIFLNMLMSGSALLFAIGPIVSFFGIRRLIAPTQGIDFVPDSLARCEFIRPRTASRLAVMVWSAAFAVITAVTNAVAIRFNFGGAGEFESSIANAILYRAILLVPATWLTRNIILLARFRQIAQSTRMKGFTLLSGLRALSIVLAAIAWVYALTSLVIPDLSVNPMVLSYESPLNLVRVRRMIA